LAMGMKSLVGKKKLSGRRGVGVTSLERPVPNRKIEGVRDLRGLETRSTQRPQKEKKEGLSGGSAPTERSILLRKLGGGGVRTKEVRTH